LVRAAASAEADAIKFQIVYADDLAQPGYVHYDLFKTLEMSADDWGEVRALARSLGIGFYADVFGPRSIDTLEKIHADGVKLHSTSFFDEELISQVGSLAPQVLVSIGGIRLEELLEARPRFSWTDSVATLMYGYQAEPTPILANNLLRIPGLQRETGLEVGFMDHSDGGGSDVSHLSLIALAMGVEVFEKHITLSRNLEMEDFVSALDPSAFLNYVRTLHRLHGALGTQDLDLLPEEMSYRERSLKRVVAGRRIEKGARVNSADVALLRPADSGGVYRLSDVLGRRAKRVINAGDVLREEFLL
jgi:N,N'-diacetyllegionaminate synthase